MSGDKGFSFDEFLSSLIKGQAEIKVEEKPAEERAARKKEKPLEEVIDRYGMVEIVVRRDSPVPIYRVNLPRINKEEREALERVREQAISEIEIDPMSIPDPNERRRIFREKVIEIMKRDPLLATIPVSRLNTLADMIVADMIGYGPLDYLLADDKLEEVMVIGTNKPVYVAHRKYGMCKTNIVFRKDEEIKNIIDKIARPLGRRIDYMSPLLDARLPDGSRVNATIPPVTLDGPTITIRKFRSDPFTVVDLINFGTMSTELAAFLWLCVDGLFAKPANILVAGGTGSGKTTTLNCLCAFIPASERVITIEDTAELQLPVKHWVRLETRPPNIEGKGEITMDDLLRNALRMRPDRIIVGEVRGSEAKTLFAAMNTGHSGCMGTVHSNTAQETITRLTSAPMNVPSVMIPALDLIVMQARMYHKEKGLIRRIIEVCEVVGMEGGRIQLNRIFEWNARKDEVVPTGVPSRVKQEIADYAGYTLEEVDFELKRRQLVLEWMKAKGKRSLSEVGKIIHMYQRDPDRVVELAMET